MPLFKNIVFYRIAADWAPPSMERLDAQLQRLAFTPCQPTQELSTGWIPPRGAEHGAMVEGVNGQWILKLAVERKAVPGAAVRAELEARCKQVEAQTGRKPGRKEKSEMKDEIVLTFLPRAFSKHATHSLWLDLEQRCVVIAAGSMKAAEPVVKHLLDVMAELGHAMPLAPVSTSVAPATAMGEWLTTRQAPEGFAIERDLELKNPGEEKSVVRYARHTLELDEIAQHIGEGKLPTQLAMTWNDKVSFVLTEQLGIRKIDIRDVEETPKGEDGFDADVAIATGELSMLLPQLLESLGGELVA
ncbi:recombination-associated protein RdgC [Caenimonas aquaedulcis]|uniref:Recombination-associated protein RdgC n=1 Tax=Caenimonas aquaedulcis TaxID=2793270 RepID=A0A931H4V9_9BURK|nr:recombination-associated protein RdgC [Caenimonas aquaedulcis]MBG9388470.1 recombination-associated protein RdgC [Caenimonas aquaedulcis]